MVYEIHDEFLAGHMLFAYAKKIENHQDYQKIGDEFFNQFMRTVNNWYFNLRGIQDTLDLFEDSVVFKCIDGKCYLSKLSGFVWHESILDHDIEMTREVAPWVKPNKISTYKKAKHIYDLFTSRMSGDFYIESSDIDNDEARKKAAYIFNLNPGDDLRGLGSIQDTGLFDFKK